MRIAVLTVSDGAAAGTREDRSGAAIVTWARGRGDDVVAHDVVPDATLDIVRQLLRWCDGDEADLVLTTGGTGLSPRDVTPEATRAVVEREAPGIAERLRAHGLRSTPRAALGRGIAGARARTLVVNLPGSTAGVEDALAALEPVVEHAVRVLRDLPTDHSSGVPPVARRPSLDDSHGGAPVPGPPSRGR